MTHDEDSDEVEDSGRVERRAWLEGCEAELVAFRDLIELAISVRTELGTTVRGAAQDMRDAFDRVLAGDDPADWWVLTVSLSQGDKESRGTRTYELILCPDEVKASVGGSEWQRGVGSDSWSGSEFQFPFDGEISHEGDFIEFQIEFEDAIRNPGFEVSIAKNDEPVTDEDEEEQDDSDDETSEDAYVLAADDRRVLAALQGMLGRLSRSALPSPAQLITVAKAMHVLQRVPEASAEHTLSVLVTGPRRKFGQHEIYHWWQLEIQGRYIAIQAGGHFWRPETGGDSFLAFCWSASPGEESSSQDFLHNLRIVDDAAPFAIEVNAVDFGEDGYTLEVTDENNPALDEGDGASEEVEDDDDDEGFIEETEGESSEEAAPSAPPTFSPETIQSLLEDTTPAERQLLAKVDWNAASRFSEAFAARPGSCDECGVDLRGHRLYVDARYRGEIMWGNLCAECFALKGEGIGWGAGQLYVRLPDDRWILAAGGKNEDSEA